MVLSEKDPKDKKRMKSGLAGVIILLALGSPGTVIILLALGSPGTVIIREFAGIDLETLCGKGEAPEEGSDTCRSDGVSREMLRAMGYASVAVAVVGFVGFAIVGVKY